MKSVYAALAKEVMSEALAQTELQSVSFVIVDEIAVTYCIKTFAQPRVC